MVGVLLIFTNGIVEQMPMWSATDDKRHCGVMSIDQTCFFHHLLRPAYDNAVIMAKKRGNKSTRDRINLR